MTTHDPMAAKLLSYAKAVGLDHRTDLTVTDVSPMERGRSVRVLAEYAPVYGVPSTGDLKKWFSAAMGEHGRAVAIRQESIRAMPENSLLTFVVENHTERQPFSAASSMIQASPGNYLDQDNNLWEVVKSATGPSYLVRKPAMTAAEMMECRQKALQARPASGTITLAAMEEMPYAPGGNAVAGVGDIVQVLSNGVVKNATITTVNDNGIKIKVEGGESELIQRGQILSVVEKSAASQTAQDNLVGEYFIREFAANPEMVKIIAPHMSRTPTPPKQMKDLVSGSAANPTVRAAGSQPQARAHSGVSATFTLRKG